MKPRLLKFTCHSCGARLAVPPEMAGLSDACPKCGVLVTAPPLAEPVTAPATSAVAAQTAVPAETPTAKAPEGWSADALADALKPQPRREPPEPKREVQPDLLSQAPEPPPPAPGEAEPAQPLRKPAHEVLDSILRRKETTVQPPVPKPQPSPAVDSHGAPTVTAPTALVPQQVTDAREVQKAAMPGMGEVLSGAGLGSTVSHAETRPFLHVPFVPVRSSPGEERHARRTHFKLVAIICFLLFDVLAIFIWKDQIFGWLGGRKEDAAAQPPGGELVSGDDKSVPKGLGTTRPGPSLTEAAEPAPAPTMPAEQTPAADAAPPAAASASATPGGLPLAPLPGGLLTPASTTLQPNLATGSLTIAAPGDFSAGPASAARPPTPPAVPMAIPLPGHSSENVPTATPVTPTTPPAPETKAPPATPAPATGTTPAETPGAPAAAPTNTAPATMAATAPTPAPLPSPTEASVPSPPPVAAPAPMAAAATNPTPAEAVPAPALAPPPSAGSRRIGRVPADARSALEGLLKFLDAPTWKDRTAHVQKQEAVASAMEKHAAAHGDGPIVVGQVDFVERYPGKGAVPPYCMFELGGGPLTHPVLVLVEQPARGGARVDWEAFIEFKDDLLLRFLEKKGAPPQKFRVLLRRKHYFDKDVPDIAGKDSFQLDQPNSHFEGHVFVPRSSALGRQLANQLAWGQDMPVIAELVWKSDAKSWWVEIAGIVSYGWRG